MAGLKKVPGLSGRVLSCFLDRTLPGKRGVSLYLFRMNSSGVPEGTEGLPQTPDKQKGEEILLF
ncbi:hypothetical protein LptCag_1682 [Leptospirillum ferriphilum]|uniref:Uncharacterized protein n=1 Tax=Leptospirillum ferriphilum TaxID=178606 RepID=A0A094W5V1_9BACT|nr:hypothetical protein LptCag_1682 [Leptospirillum ferriphilum]